MSHSLASTFVGLRVELEFFGILLAGWSAGQGRPFYQLQLSKVVEITLLSWLMFLLQREVLKVRR